MISAKLIAYVLQQHLFLATFYYSLQGVKILFNYLYTIFTLQVTKTRKEWNAMNEDFVTLSHNLGVRRPTAYIHS